MLLAVRRGGMWNGAPGHPLPEDPLGGGARCDAGHAPPLAARPCPNRPPSSMRTLAWPQAMSDQRAIVGKDGAANEALRTNAPIRLPI